MKGGGGGGAVLHRTGDVLLILYMIASWFSMSFSNASTIVPGSCRPENKKCSSYVRLVLNRMTARSCRPFKGKQVQHSSA